MNRTIKGWGMDTTIEQEIEKAIDLAKNGTREQQENFVDWACSSIRWLSSQGKFAECEMVEKQYKAYLSAKGEERTVQLLSEESGKSKTTIYNLAKKLGRLPTVEELNNQKKGRPKKYV